MEERALSQTPRRLMTSRALDRNSAANAFGPYKSVIRPERPETLQPTRCRLSALLRFRRGGHLARSFTAFQEGVALLDLHFLGTSELRGCESPYDFSFFLTIFSLPRGLGRGEEATDGTISGTR